MKKISIFLFFILAILNIYAQGIESDIYAFKLDSTYLYIDNSDHRWFTLEIKTDTLFSIDDNLLYIDGKALQINTVPFDNGRENGTMGSIKAEKQAISWHKKWDLDYQAEFFGTKLKSKEKFYTTKSGKPYMIWWYEMPKESEQTRASSSREIVINDFVEDEDISDDEIIDIVTETLTCTHQLLLDFVINSNICVAVCVSVFDNNKLSDEIEKLKEMANTLNVYGGNINLIALSERLNNDDMYILKDNDDLIEITVPKDVNIIQQPYEYTFTFTFPEKENIINAASILWERKSDSVTFEDFKEMLKPKNPDDNSLVALVREENKEQLFFTRNNAWFYSQNVYLEGENVYCFINFTATKDTYNFNLDRFYKLLNNIKLK